ncbi:MAG TPA: peptidoglycan-associated lipoprotein Pal [Acidobacteriota bacterium]|nr:peptidoglycan-associated lipoprotein Pal [Acidobacteriota bacterium]
MKRYSHLVFLMVFSSGLLTVGSSCKRQPPQVSRPGPIERAPAADRPAAAAPTIQIGAEPSSIRRGGQATLSWSSTDASSVVIDSGVGTVGPSGTLTVAPLESITYTATASGPGGDARASARVTVVRGEDAGTVDETDIDRLQRAIDEGRVRPVFFAYDRSDLSSEARTILEENARWFREFPGARIIIEGHCDERGTEEYNLALGDGRAQAAREFLVQLGVEPARLETVSYGEERPFAHGQTEADYALNRRAHFVVAR